MSNSAAIDAWAALPTDTLLAEAGRVRHRNFGPEVVFAAPGSKYYENEYFKNSRSHFAVVSVTGSDCSLKCEHCRGRLLTTMHDCPTPAELLAVAERLQADGCQGLLISGGADASGAVPLDGFLEALAELKRRGLTISVHTGLASPATIAGLKQAGVDQVLLDVIGDAATIQTVYHLERTPDDYSRVLADFQREGLESAPHIVAGLHYGELRGELEALKMVSATQPRQLVIVVLSPLAGTPMAKVVPPGPEECARLIALARLANPTAYLSLGCARPAGRQRAVLEKLALEAGVNAIADPSAESVPLARAMGLAVKFSDLCCTYGQ